MAPDTPEGLLAALEGRWRLAREIADRRGPPGGFAGEALFAAGPGGLIYREAGVLRLDGGPPMRAERGYLWRTEGGLVVVDFADGRPFHRFDPARARPEAEHPCGADLYRVAYDFTGWPVWRAVWDVAGPRKAYRMASVWRPA
jgi:hypothetical protein